MKNRNALIAICIGIVLIIGFVFIQPTMQKRAEWNKISKDYDIIAEVAFDYYNKHISDRYENDKTIFLDISADGDSLTETIYSIDGENKVYDIALTDKQKTALKNITKFYIGPKRQEQIMIRSSEELEISDNDAVGTFAVIKSKIKPSGWRNHKIYNLGNDWWQVVSSTR